MYKPFSFNIKDSVTLIQTQFKQVQRFSYNHTKPVYVGLEVQLQPYKPSSNRFRGSVATIQTQFMQVQRFSYNHTNLVHVGLEVQLQPYKPSSCRSRVSVTLMQYSRGSVTLIKAQLSYHTYLTCYMIEESFFLKNGCM